MDAKRLYFHLPATFDPMEFLPSRMVMDADFARYFVSIILTKLAHCRVDENGFVRLHAKYLNRIMGQRHTAAIVQSLVDGGAVRRCPYSVLDRKSFGYTLGDRYVADRAVTLPMTNPLLIERLRKFHEEFDREDAARMEPIHHHLAEQQQRLRIDRDQAEEILARLPPESNPFGVQDILVDDIVNHRYRMSVGQYGRVSNNITSLKRELRKPLRVHREHLIGVDIACCQPALMALLMRDKYPSCKLKGVESYNASVVNLCLSSLSPPVVFPRDFEVFTQLVCSGKLYEFLLSQLAQRGSEMSRKELKHRFLCDVIAKNVAKYGEYPSAVEDVVRDAFPTMCWFVRHVNQGGHHETLIRALQQTESAVVIGDVCQRFADKHPKTFLITVHDSIYTTPSHVDAVTSAFDEVFTKLDFPMKLKVGE